MLEWPLGHLDRPAALPWQTDSRDRYCDAQPAIPLVEQSSYPAGSCARSRVLHRGYLETRELSRVPHLACHPATTAELQAEDAAIAAYLQWLPGSFLPGARPLPASGQIRRLAVRKPGLLRSDSNPRAANFRS